jgi:hypothetical protein
VCITGDLAMESLPLMFDLMGLLYKNHDKMSM